ncbi:MAG: CRISPR-associated CARF protein Csa3 [Desulfurococcales archaeon]|nr:CRISPR-associated CARF protein Csa3 [Desulfurococcales archaeon]
MPGRLFIATLGFHENFIIRLLNSRAARGGDGLLLVTVKPAAGAVLTAYNNTLAFSARLGVKVYPLLELDPADVAESLHTLVHTITDLAREQDYREIIMDITGGSRIVALQAVLAALILRGMSQIELIVQSDTGGDWEAKITGSILDALACGVGDKIKVLTYLLANPGASTHQIAEATGLAPKTVANYISKLKRHGLVYQKGRGGGVYLTGWGKLLASITHKK